MKRLALLLSMIAPLVGCGPIRDAAEQCARRMEREMERRPTCAAERECSAMWLAARDWVAGHCGNQIRVTSDDFIETDREQSLRLYCRVSKRPLPDGRYSIELTATGGEYGNSPPWDVECDALRDFNVAVDRAGEPFRAPE